MDDLIIYNQSNDWTNGIAIAGTAAIGLGLLIAANGEKKRKIIATEASCMSSSRLNDLAEYIREVDDEKILEFDGEIPPLSVIDRKAAERAKSTKNISHPAAKAVHEQVLRARYLTIAMIRTGCQLVSWIPGGTAFASPMELWNEVSQFYWDLVFKDGCILSNKLDDNKVKWLTMAAADLELLVNELYSEWSGSILERGDCPSFMCTSNPTFLTAIKKSTLSINFIKRIAHQFDGGAFVHFNGVPKTYLCSAILRDLAYSSVKNLKKYCCEEHKQTSKVMEKFEELLMAAVQSDKTEHELAKEISEIEKSIMIACK